MAKRFSTLQKEAEEKGYSLSESDGRYYASWEGINLDDDDRDRLVDDMDALIECSADNSPFELQEAPNEDGEAVITWEGQTFEDLSIAKALAKAKEAKLAKEKPAPTPPKRAFARPKPVEPDRKPGMELKVVPPQEVVKDTDGGLIEDEPWQEPAPASPNGPAPTQTIGQDDKAVLARLCGRMAELLLEAQRLLELPSQAAPMPQAGGKPRISRGR
jgi:hypothetical protein